MKIPFNKPHFTGKEQRYLLQAAMKGRFSGNGPYTKEAHDLFRERYGVKKALLTTSCTDALEMIAILFKIQPGDEVIMPSYTFVSTANAFVLRGAKIVFADSMPDHPNIDIDGLESLITQKTKAIVVMHYGGIANDMNRIIALANKYNLLVAEDAAQSIESTYHGQQLGTIGHLGAFSFHETKNIVTGEGGMLLVNEESLTERAEILWEKGTNRAAFQRGEVQKYEWVDVGSSFLPSDLVAATLCAQMSHVEDIQAKRVRHWIKYFEGLKHLQAKGKIQLPIIPEYASINGHLFYIVTGDRSERDRLLGQLQAKGINAVFHYLSLHSSPYYKDKHDGRELPNADRYSDCLIRLPLYYSLTEKEINYVVKAVEEFYL
ncbi:MAG: dTDP-4-amino-4,6-dideoxygalactose transaminase [Marinilabiliales bacterium]|nr:MAG: dTDP-4-amino-4,6-dideoxygalactose transaminase [Marinilabiliales bacterium]